MQVDTVSGNSVNLIGKVVNPHWGQTYSLDSITVPGVGPDQDPNVTCSDRAKPLRGYAGGGWIVEPQHSHYL